MSFWKKWTAARPGEDQVFKDVENYSAKNYKPLPVVLSKGKGAYVWDTEGKKYLDALSAYSALNHGHRHPKILAAMNDQASRLTLSSRAFHNDQMGVFLKKLCQVAGMEMALPMNTGAEAVETAIKMARKWGYLKKKVVQDRAEIIVCENNFHGRTTTIVSFSTENQYRAGFGPFTPGFRVIPYGDLQALKAAIHENTVAFLYEPIQGEGGVIVPPQGFLTEAAKICRKNGVLLMADEIQTGLGRTGRTFCYQHDDDAKPDVLILGKALGGGVYPVSAALASKEVMGVFNPGDHGSTFGGNPMAAAIGLAALNALEDEKMVENSAEMGAYLIEKIREIQAPHAIQEVRGKGLMIGIEFKKEYGPARAVCEKLAIRGILCKDTHDQTMRITPPLIIGIEECDLIVEQIAAVLAG
ncbi:MAG: ornithine--oxo-acid transaminase [Bdellovibrionales bacterium]|nr:ornithine--oxo-acid transaminase [Bdellovibrionales bacterium]